jgi:FHS family glucose/mannose:H+ symporter-like MFS transporter
MSARRTTLLGCLLFIAIGMTTPLLGTVLPLLASRWGISPVQAGLLFSWQFLISVAGTLLGAVLLRRAGFRAVIFAGLALTTVGVAALFTHDWLSGRLAVACYGFGLGMAIAPVNLGVAHAAAEARASMLSLLNCSWAIGAVIGPLAFYALRTYERFIATLIVALVLACVLSLFFAARPEAPAFRPTQKVTGVITVALLYGGLMYLAVGTETAIAGWASTLSLPHFATVANAALPTASFWFCFLIARAVSPLVLRAWTATALLYASLAMALFGTASFFVSAGPVSAVLACGLAGLGIGPVFPMIAARLTGSLGTDTPVAVACFACGGIGAGTLPALAGAVGQHAHNTRAALGIPLLGLSALLLLLRVDAGEASPAPAPRVAEG